MTPTQSLSERLRQGVGHEPADIMAAERTMDEAADAIVRLMAESNNRYWEERWRADFNQTTEALKALDAKSALLAQATAALDEIMRWWGEDTARMDEPHFVTLTRATLAAIREAKP